MATSTDVVVAWSTHSFVAGVVWMLDVLGIAVSLAMFSRYRAPHMMVLAVVSALHLLSFNGRFISLVLDGEFHTRLGDQRAPSATTSDMIGNTAGWLYTVAFTSMNAHRLYCICYGSFPRLVLSLLVLALLANLFRSANFVLYCIEIAAMHPLDMSGLATVTMNVANLFEMAVNGAIGLMFVVYLQLLYVKDSTATKHDRHLLAEMGMAELLRRLQYLLAVEVMALTVACAVTEALPNLDPQWSMIWISLSFRNLTYCYLLSSLATIMKSLASVQQGKALDP
jgi:hypothetical protein